MKERRIGVWFSLALVILLLSAWLGSSLGVMMAGYRYRREQKRSLGTLSASEHAHLESVLDELDSIEFSQMTLLVSLNDENLKKTLPKQLAYIENLRRKLNTEEAKPVLDLNLALADLVVASTEEQGNNKELAATHMKSAQSLFQSLGWQDYSEDTLRTLTSEEIDHWKVGQQRSKNVK